MGRASSVPHLPTAEQVAGSNLPFSLFSAFPHNGQNIGLSPFLGTLNTGGSLPDLTNLHYSAPLPASLDTSDHLFGSMSVGNSVGNLPAAMTHLGIRNSSSKYSHVETEWLCPLLYLSGASLSENDHVSET